MLSFSQYCLANEGSKVCGKWEGKQKLEQFYKFHDRHVR